MARIRAGQTPNACPIEPTSNSKLPEMPDDKRFRNMIGSAVITLDIDEHGKSSNPRLLAAVPSEAFGQVIVKELPRMTFKRRAQAESGCSLAQKNYVFTITFHIN